MTNQNQYMNIPAEKFKFTQRTDLSHDKKFDTKPVSYFQGAFRRFCKNKGAIVGAIVILCLVLFAIIAPAFTPYSPEDYDSVYKYAYPKLPLLAESDISFWDGCKEKTGVPYLTFLQDYAIAVETGREVIKNGEYTKNEDGSLYSYRFDTYYGVGFSTYKELSPAEFEAIQEYQNRTGRQVLYPVVRLADRPTEEVLKKNANLWYKLENPQAKANKIRPVVDGYDEQGNPILVPNYWKYEVGQDASVPEYNSLRIEGEDGVIETTVVIDENGEVVRDKNGKIVKEEKQYYYSYGQRLTNGNIQVRAEYYEYYIYMHTEVLKDGISEPVFLFGATETGKDIFGCLAYGARFSFIFASVVAIVNFVFGVIWGSISGYFGGTLDLAMERFCEILGSVPSTIIITLLKFHVGQFILEKGLHQLVDLQSALILFIAFFATGWIGMAGRTRMQFYRFKNQEYVLAARTLGASDARIMFKHIFPNGLGTIVTSVALVIPSMIYSETSLSYLGIINLEAGNLTSVGTLINAGQKAIQSSVGFVALFPCAFLVLLMLSFNLFGNGLRDAFNPSLRGSEE